MAGAGADEPDAALTRTSFQRVVLALARTEVQDQVVAQPAEHVLIDQIIEQPLVDDQAVDDVAP